MTAPSRSEVTIELDFDDDSGEENDIFPADFIDDIPELEFDPPITAAQVKCTVPSHVKIKDLSLDVRNFIQHYLEFPSTVSIGTLSDVQNFLDVDEQSDKKVYRDFFKPYSNMHAQILLNALEKLERIDILVKLNLLIKSGNYLQEVKENESRPSSSTSRVTGDNNLNAPPVKKAKESSDWDKTVLVVHYETTDKEKKEFSWFLQNLKRNCREKGVLRIKDIDSMEKQDEGNRLRKIEQVYYKMPHIIVCFNESYSRALCSDEVDRDFEFKKHINDKAMIEFMDNGSNNYRFRPVLMPGTRTVHRLDWVSVTLKYVFPKDFEALLKRIHEPTRKLKKENSQSSLSQVSNQLNSIPPDPNN